MLRLPSGNLRRVDDRRGFCAQNDEHRFFPLSLYRIIAFLQFSSSPSPLFPCPIARHNQARVATSRRGVFSYLLFPSASDASPTYSSRSQLGAERPPPSAILITNDNKLAVVPSSRFVRRLLPGMKNGSGSRYPRDGKQNFENEQEKQKERETNSWRTDLSTNELYDAMNVEEETPNHHSRFLLCGKLRNC